MQSLSKTLTVDQLFYLKEQFALLEPSKNDTISIENIKEVGFLRLSSVASLYLLNQSHHLFFGQAFTKSATDAMKESCIYDFISSVSS